MAETIDAVIDTIAAAITKGDTVKLVGFGSFFAGIPRRTSWS
jgi:Bacterial nucleoid DNA-binding protein